MAARELCSLVQGKVVIHADKTINPETVSGAHSYAGGLTYLGTAVGGVRSDGRKKLESRPPVFLRGGSRAEKDLETVGWAGAESLVVLMRRTGRVAM
jgi:hypothetical protein